MTRRGVPFLDRREAGKLLGAELDTYAQDPDVVVLGLPRGGIPVAFEVAIALSAPLDVFLVRKLGVPEHRELAMGAIASGGVRVLNDEVVRALGIAPMVIDAVAEQESREIRRQEREYCGSVQSRDFRGKRIILVDDGLATGSTMRAAVRALRQHQPERIIVAVPVGAVETCRELQKEADEVVCLSTPEPFHAVSLWYEEFQQTTDQEVRHLLEIAATAAARRQ
jgi:putative phosphoribosyl transferase